MLFSIIISPVFATEINNPATCDSGTLSTDTGPTNLRANYESNTLNLKWYDDDNNRINVSSTSSDSCTYGGTINLPTPPTKKGYTFKGWKVLFGLASLDYAINCTSCAALSHDGTPVTVTSVVTNNIEAYGLTTNGTWGATFGYGKVIGEAKCSGTPGVEDQPTVVNNLGQSSGVYCWCKATKYVAGDTNTVALIGDIQDVVPRAWVFSTVNDPNYNCLSNCAFRCAYNVRVYPGYRRLLFESAAD